MFHKIHWFWKLGHSEPKIFQDRPRSHFYIITLHAVWLIQNIQRDCVGTYSTKRYPPSSNLFHHPKSCDEASPQIIANIEVNPKHRTIAAMAAMVFHKQIHANSTDFVTPFTDLWTEAGTRLSSWSKWMPHLGYRWFVEKQVGWHQENHRQKKTPRMSECLRCVLMFLNCWKFWWSVSDLRYRWRGTDFPGDLGWVSEFWISPFPM